MNLACYDSVIGVRSQKNADSPSFGLYIDDLAGIDEKRMASIASKESGLAVIHKSIRNACDEAAEEALNYAPNGMPLSVITKPLGRLHMQSRFRENVLANFNGERGIHFEIKRPDLYQNSYIHIRKVYLKSSMDAAGVTVKVLDGNHTETIEPVDLMANEVKEIELSYRAKTTKISIVTDHSSVAFFQAYLPQHNSQGCTSCGGARRLNYSSSTVPHLWVTGGYGITADLAMQCDMDKIKCFILPYLRYAVLYKSAMNLALEGRFTDRLNFYSANMDFGEFFAYMEEEYQRSLSQVAPNLSRLLKPTDINCFECGGMTRTTIDY